MSGQNIQYPEGMKFLKITLCTLGVTAAVMPFAALAPALPDLQLVLHTDLTSVSTIFVCFTVCGVVACLATPLVDKVLGSNVFIAICQGGMAIFIAASSFSSNLYLFLALMCGFGALDYAVYSVYQSSCARSWQKPGAALRLLYIGDSVGWVLGPLLISPFVSPSRCFHSVDNSSTNNLNITGVHQGGECGGRIHLAFLALASLCGLAFLGAVVVLVLEGRGLAPIHKYEAIQKTHEEGTALTSDKEDTHEESDDLDEFEEPNKPDEKKKQALFLIMAVVYHIASSTGVFLPGEWLPVYGLHSLLHMELRTLSMLDGGYFFILAVGTVVSAVASIYLGQRVVMAGSLVGMVATSLVVLFLGDKTPWNLGAGILAYSFLCAPHYNGAVVLVSEVMELSTTIISVFDASFALSVEGITFGFSIVLQHFGYWVYLWTPLICACVTLVTFTATMWMTCK